MFSYLAKFRQALAVSGREAVYPEIPMPVCPAPPPVPTYPELAPVQNWSHPFRDTNNPLLQLTQLAKATSGYFPLGRNGLWHNGVHFDGGTAGTVDQTSVHCLADGEVVAYRIDETAPTVRYNDNRQTIAKPASRNFVLVRHSLQPPPIAGSADTPPRLIVYSLYMHLQDWADYKDAPLTPRPEFWTLPPACEVSENANDLRRANPYDTAAAARPRDERGATVWGDTGNAGLGFLPRGTAVKVCAEGEYVQLEGLGPAWLLDAQGKLKGYIAGRFLKQTPQGEHWVDTYPGVLNVRAEANVNSEIIGKLPHFAQITVSDEGDFRKLERVNQYVANKSLKRVREPQAQNHTLVLERPVPIKAGDLIGHIGRYQDAGDPQPEKKLHLEVFSPVGVPAFIEASRAWAQRLPDGEKTWLHFPTGTMVIADQPHFGIAQPPSKYWQNSLSAAPLSLPRNLIDSLPAESKLHVPAKHGEAACTWYRLDGLFHDTNRNLLSGWVCEHAQGVGWHSPWAWKDWEIVFNSNSLEQLFASQLCAKNRLNEEDLARFGRMAEKGDKGPLKTALREKIDLDDSLPLTANDVQQAIQLPAYAQQVASVILFSESEWMYRPQKLSALDKLTNRSKISKNLNWEAEKERVEQFDWMTEAGEKLGLPGHGQMYHFHPVWTASSFSSGRTAPFFSSTPGNVKIEFPRGLKDEGPGHWVTVDHDYHGLNNTVIMAINRLTSMGDEGRVFGSEGKDYMNTKRDKIQEWQPLTSGAPDETEQQSALYRYGEQRKITQIFLEGDDAWAITGQSWHWQPTTADDVYEKIK